MVCRAESGAELIEINNFPATAPLLARLLLLPLLSFSGIASTHRLDR